MMPARPAARRAARLISGAMCGASLAACALPPPGLGVPRPEAAALAVFRIAFTRADGVYIASGDGSAERRLIAPGDLERDEAPFLAALAPRGDQILFLSVTGRDPRSGRGRSLSLHVVVVETAGEQQRAPRRGAWWRIRLDSLMGGPGEVEPAMAPGAAWSPRGDRIAVALRRQRRGAEDAVLLAGAGGDPERLLELTGRRLVAGSGLAWLAAGDALLVAIEEAGEDGSPSAGAAIARVEAGVGGPVALRVMAPGRDPAVSPDGSRIAAVEAGPSSSGDIVLLDPGGRSIDRFERPAGRGLNHLFWSPDGRYLYYHSLASTGPMGIVEIGLLRCLDTRTRTVFDLVRLG